MTDFRQYPTDCSGCGACCHSARPRHIGYAEYKDEYDPSKLDPEFVAANVVFNKRRNTHTIKSVTSQLVGRMVRCAGSAGTPGKDGHCGIYDGRPASCRNWPRGGAHCMKVRNALADCLEKGSFEQADW